MKRLPLLLGLVLTAAAPLAAQTADDTSVGGQRGFQLDANQAPRFYVLSPDAQAVDACAVEATAPSLPLPLPEAKPPA